MVLHNGEMGGFYSKFLMCPGLAGKGFSLAELLVVIVIVGIVASVAIPTFSSNNHKKVDVATNEVVQALRFSRNEAIRTGKHHGVRITSDQARVQVFWLDLSTATPTERLTVYDPLSKQIYERNINTLPVSAGVLASADFLYAVAGVPEWAVAFNSRGEPMAASDLKPLISGDVVLNLNSSSKTITVAPLTGRVTVQ